MACRSGKVEHPTREAALDAQKVLVYHNHVRGRTEMSARLNVYPCPHCGAWHVGRVTHAPPACYHYAFVDALDALIDHGQLVPPKPQRFSARAHRFYTGQLLAWLRELEEEAPLLWFSWSATWDPRTPLLPHPGRFLARPAPTHLADGIVRLAAPAYVAKLRWSDYMELNKKTPGRTGPLRASGNPADWLATDAAVPASAIASIDVWSGGAWRDVDAVAHL